MRTERQKDGTYSVWLTRPEYHELRRKATTDEREIAIRLMGDCGLRASEALDVCHEHVSRMPDGRHYALEVVSGKDTSGEYSGGKHRETWLPVDTETAINRHVQREGIDDGEPLVDVSRQTLWSWVNDAADAAADETGDGDYRRVSTHDLRRCWANHLLVEQNVSPRIVMALGGWSSYDAIEPYLAAPTEENIIDSMAEASL